MRRSFQLGTILAAAIAVAPLTNALAHEHEAHATATAAYGHAGESKDVTRTITLIATEMRYSESALTVTSGETIRFVLVNNGRVDHELMIADAHTQMEHRMAMLADEGAHHADHHHEDNVVAAKPGETKELIWTFTAPGEFEYACNYPGHAEKGMTGKITVLPAPAAQQVASDHEGGEHHMHHGADAHRQNDDTAHEHAGMQMNGALGPYTMTREASGTSWQPDASNDMGRHLQLGPWSVMTHVLLNAVYDWQGGARGDEKAFVSGMVMAMAQRDLGGGDTLGLRAMLSPDPFMGKSGYPLLLAAGETADGKATLLDRQHPHDLFMELAATLSHRLSEDESVFLYAGLPGEPAFGPPAFMHRLSAGDSPEAPVTHHWFDSTHITFGVLTAGFVTGDWKFEVSGFRGREPDQDRFDIEGPKLDSASARLSFNPDENWSLQVSWADVHSPEQLEPDVDETRISASAIYTIMLGEDSWWSSTIGWAVKDPSDGGTLDAVMLETAYAPDGEWTAFARGELVENRELSGTGRTDTVGKISLGLIRDFAVADHLKLGIGALYAFDFVPDALEPSYGGDEHGATIFLRLKSD